MTGGFVENPEVVSSSSSSSSISFNEIYLILID